MDNSPLDNREQLRQLRIGMDELETAYRKAANFRGWAGFFAGVAVGLVLSVGIQITVRILGWE